MAGRLFVWQLTVSLTAFLPQFRNGLARNRPAVSTTLQVLPESAMKLLVVTPDKAPGKLRSGHSGRLLVVQIKYRCIRH